MARKRKAGTSPVVWMLRGLLVAVLVGMVVAFFAERDASTKFDSVYARVKPLVEVGLDKRSGPKEVQAAASLRPISQEMEGVRVVAEVYRVHGVVRNYDFRVEYSGTAGHEFVELVKPLQ